MRPLFRGKHTAMKMDKESSEFSALSGGELFFQEVDVKMVQMEFTFHRRGRHGNQIVDFLARKGYQPFGDLRRSSALNSNALATWPNEIYLMKSALLDTVDDHVPNIAESNKYNHVE